MCAIINKTVLLYVKNTMIDTLLSYIAPHHCFGCGQIGAILCDNCRYYISMEPYVQCVACGGYGAADRGVCTGCRAAYDRAWCVGERRDELLGAVDAYKFERAKAAGKTLAALLDAILPQLPTECRLVPVPTIASHIRERGYDHTLLMARSLARARGVLVDAKVLRRTHSLVQRGTTRSVRRRQAASAFTAGPIDPEAIYVIVDDVVTTGATVQFAAKTLKDAGASQVWVAAICRQPLD